MNIPGLLSSTAIYARKLNPIAPHSPPVKSIPIISPNPVITGNKDNSGATKDPGQSPPYVPPLITTKDDGLNTTKEPGESPPYVPPLVTTKDDGLNTDADPNQSPPYVPPLTTPKDGSLPHQADPAKPIAPHTPPITIQPVVPISDDDLPPLTTGPSPIPYEPVLTTGPAPVPISTSPTLRNSIHPISPEPKPTDPKNEPVHGHGGKLSSTQLYKNALSLISDTSAKAIYTRAAHLMGKDSAPVDVTA